MPRILLVDDDVVQLGLYTQLLEIAGYGVEIAITASETERCMETAPADLVIMDLRIPNALGESDSQEGMALIRRIRDLDCHHRIADGALHGEGAGGPGDHGSPHS